MIYFMAAIRLGSVDAGPESGEGDQRPGAQGVFIQVMQAGDEQIVHHQMATVGAVGRHHLKRTSIRLS